MGSARAEHRGQKDFVGKRLRAGAAGGVAGEAALGNKDLKLLPEEACSTCIARDKVTSPSPPSLIPRAVLS